MAVMVSRLLSLQVLSMLTASSPLKVKAAQLQNLAPSSLTTCCAADHYLIGVQTATNVTIPDWVLALPPPATQ